MAQALKLRLCWGLGHLMCATPAGEGGRERGALNIAR